MPLPAFDPADEQRSAQEYKTLDDQIKQLKHGVDIFVGTTGRVLDHIDRGNIDFSNIKSLVLDEADQMLKLGFKEDVDKIFGQMQK